MTPSDDFGISSEVDRTMTPLDAFEIFVHEALRLLVGLFLSQQEVSER